MPIEICTVSGYNEMGKNMTAIKVDDDVIIIDMGLDLEAYIKFTEDDELISTDPKDLMDVGAIPNTDPIEDWRKNVRAIIPTHAHLDHIGAIPYLANEFSAPVICTAFTAAVIKEIVNDQRIRLKNPIKTVAANTKFKISKNLEVEFVHMTHSTPQTIMVALHTKYGIVAYANDFKFDLFPTLGPKPDFNRLKVLGEKGITALIVESTYAELEAKMPSEMIVKQMLMEVLYGVNSKDKAIIVTTFSSHLARLKSILEFAKNIDRKVVFLGRSLNKYISAGESIDIISFSKQAEVVPFSSQVKKKLKKIMTDGKDKYLLVVTGHMGEPKSLLFRMAKKQTPFEFSSGDIVVFSNKVIPTPINVANRQSLEASLKSLGVRIFKDIHVSGHAAREDLRDMLTYLKPMHVIPAHGDLKMRGALLSLAVEMGYKNEKTVHLMQNGDRLNIEKK